MGMDPYEERLLIILLGSGVGLLALLTMLFVCFRKYRIDNKNPRHQRAQQRAIGFGWQQPGAGPMGRHQMIYQPTGHQPTGGLAMMEPGCWIPESKRPT
ncbi:hypothetical protein BOX15_Mlig017332g2 [Macrostomum lignano]|uniref:Uncharacterized protein n=1 Tax=Macrostomum lignano TaxID=282301 RepID=A0A267EDW7_9PLAT|nr:hypothetical protein BOX15_Mlig017332g2 [Macrostomum lignano]